MDIDTKAEIARSSCLTKACQPHIANMHLSAKIPDPELYAMQMSLIHARDYMHFASQAERQQFFRIVATSNQHPGRSTGPAAALQRYLQRSPSPTHPFPRAQLSLFQELSFLFSKSFLELSIDLSSCYFEPKLAAFCMYKEHLQNQYINQYIFQ